MYLPFMKGAWVVWRDPNHSPSSHLGQWFLLQTAPRERPASCGKDRSAFTSQHAPSSPPLCTPPYLPLRLSWGCCFTTSEVEWLCCLLSFRSLRLLKRLPRRLLCRQKSLNDTGAGGGEQTPKPYCHVSQHWVTFCFMSMWVLVLNS